jgi:hypothetical protein
MTANRSAEERLVPITDWQEPDRGGHGGVQRGSCPGEPAPADTEFFPVRRVRYDESPVIVWFSPFVHRRDARKRAEPPARTEVEYF